MNREEIYSALKAKLKVSVFRTVSRRLKHWTDVPKNQQPAIFVQQDSEDRTWSGRIPGGIKFLHANLIIYFRSDAGVAPSSVSNPLLDAVDVALDSDDSTTELCTLGGLVAFCRIEGRVEIDEGAQDGQGIIRLPVKISLY